MEPLVFHLSGFPRGQGRPRATARGGYAKVYKDDRDRKYEAAVRKVAVAAMSGRAPIEGPVSVSMQFRLPIPVSYPKRTREAMAAGEIPPTTKPDLSNMVKAIEDAMNAVVFVDDTQIVRAFATKIYHAKPGVDVKVTAFEPQPGDETRPSHYAQPIGGRGCEADPDRIAGGRDKPDGVTAKGSDARRQFTPTGERAA